MSQEVEAVIKYDDLEMALEFASSGEEFGSYAYIDRESGQVYYVSDDVDEEYPDDIDENERYLLVPHKRELGLGKLIAIEFTEEYLPNEIDSIYRIFNSRGAYSAFKSVLEKNSLLDSWYKYEKEVTQKALMQWSNEVGLCVII
jgi:hypothetical protein